MTDDAASSRTRSPVFVVRGVVEAVQRGCPLSDLLASDVSAIGYFTGEVSLEGLTAVEAGLHDVRSSMYAITVDSYRELDPTCVVGVGSVRHGTAGGGLSQHAAAWLWVVSTDVLQRWESFDEVEATIERHAVVCPGRTR